MSKRKRRGFGSVVKITGREGYWFRAKYRTGELLPNGTPKYRSINAKAGATKREAEDFAGAVQRWMGEGYGVVVAVGLAQGKRAPSTGNALTFSHLIASYRAAPDGLLALKPKTRTGNESRLDILDDAEWSARAIEDLKRADIRKWREKRLTEVSGRTVNSDLSVASAVWRWAEEAELAPEDLDNPFRACRVKRRRIVVKRRTGLTIEQARALLDAAEEACSPEAVLFMRAAVCTGWRLGELACLTASDYDTSHHVDGRKAPRLRVPREHEKRGRLKFAFPAGKLAGALADAKSGLLFRQPNGSSWADPKRINLQLRKALKKVKDKAIPHELKWGSDEEQLAPFSFHGLRHTTETICHELRISTYTADALLGHSSGAEQRMGQHYTRVTDAQVRDACAAIVRAIEARPARILKVSASDTKPEK